MEISDVANITGGEAKATKALADKAEQELALAKRAADALAIAQDTYPYIQSGDLKNTKAIDTTKRILKSDADKEQMRITTKGAVLLATARVETAGRCGILSEDAIVNNAIRALMPRIDKIRLDFLFYYFRLLSTQDEIKHILTVTGRPQLRQEDIGQLDIPLPPPEIQDRIVRRLNAVLAEIRQSKLALEHIEQQISQVEDISIDKLFSAIARDQRIPQYALRDLVTIPKPQSHSIDEIEMYGNYPYISPTELVTGGIRHSEVKLLREVEKKPRQFNVLENASSTILYALTTPRLKRVALLNDVWERLVYSPNVLPLKVNSGSLDASFCMWALIAAPFTQFISGTVIQRVPQEKVQNYLLPLPPLPTGCATRY